MAGKKFSQEKIQELRDLATGWGKVVARRAFEDAGPDTSVDFQTMEQIATAVASALTQGILASLLEQQASTLAPEHPCPKCGCLCPVGTEPRALNGPHVQVPYDEPVCHCPACRRDFFPPAHRPAPGQP